MEILAEGFKFIRKVVQTSPFGDLVEEETFPGSSIDLSSDEKIKGRTFIIGVRVSDLMRHS